MSPSYDHSVGEQLYRSRIIYLSGDITTSVADHVVSRLLVLDSIDPRTEIKLYISSYGGSVYSGLAIYDAMQLIDAPVATFCIGPAFSMAAWLLASGQPGRRLATPNSRIMIHQPSSGFLGTSADIKVAAANVMQLEELLVGLLAKQVGRPSAELSATMQRDVWMTAEEAVDFGIIDAIALPSSAKLTSVRERPRAASES